MLAASNLILHPNYAAAASEALFRGDISVEGYAEVMKSIIDECTGKWHLRVCAILMAEFGWSSTTPIIRGTEAIVQMVRGQWVQSGYAMHLLPRALSGGKLNARNVWNWKGTWGVFDFCDSFNEVSRSGDTTGGGFTTNGMRLLESMRLTFGELSKMAGNAVKAGRNVAMKELDPAPSDAWFVTNEMSPIAWWATRSMLNPGGWLDQSNRIVGPQESARNGIQGPQGSGLVCASCHADCSFESDAQWRSIFTFQSVQLQKGERPNACSDDTDGFACQVSLGPAFHGMTLDDKAADFKEKMDAGLKILNAAIKQLTQPRHG